MLEKILNLDEKLFLYINGCNNEFFDIIMFQISNKWIWIPLYLFLIYLLIKKYGNKIYIILAVLVLTIIISDLVSVHLFKNIFQRLRPCHDDSINSFVHIVNNKCGGKFGFLSSHASNHAAIAVFVGLLLRKNNVLIFPILLFWALIISYSRVYLGVHFPGDVIAGILLGFFIGFFMYLLLKKKNRKIFLHSS